MIEDRFIYLLLPIPFLIVTAIIFILRKDLRHRIIKIGLIGGIAGWVSNLWYFIDYWHPPSLFGQTVLSIEDFLVGFSVAAAGVTLYPFITKTKPASTKGLKKNKLLLGTVLLWVVPFVILVNFGNVPSPVVSFGVVLAFLAVMLIRAPRFLKQALIVGGIFAVIGLIDYFFLFNVFSTGYLDRYFLLTGQWYNPTLFGFYPLLELLWYFTWGAFASTFIDYLGRKVTPKNDTKASKA